MTSSLPSTSSDWIALIEDESKLLTELAEATIAARSASLRDTNEGLMSHLETQSNLCQRLEASRARRRRALRAAGKQLDDLAAVVTDTTDPAERERAEKALDRWIEAASATQRENDLNREFYLVALGAVEEAVSIITGSKTSAYDPKGRTVSGLGRSFMATSI